MHMAAIYDSVYFMLYLEYINFGIWDILLILNSSWFVSVWSFLFVHVGQFVIILFKFVQFACARSLHQLFSIKVAANCFPMCIPQTKQLCSQRWYISTAENSLHMCIAHTNTESHNAKRNKLCIPPIELYYGKTQNYSEVRTDFYLFFRNACYLLFRISGHKKTILEYI